MMAFVLDGIECDSDDLQRFASKVKRDGDHWLWVGGAGPFRHGTFYIHQGDNWVQVSTRRFAYAARNGRIERGQTVVVTCDDDRCVRPEHLALASKLDAASAVEVLESATSELERRIQEMEVIVAGLGK